MLEWVALPSVQVPSPPCAWKTVVTHHSQFLLAAVNVQPGDVTSPELSWELQLAAL